MEFEAVNRFPIRLEVSMVATVDCDAEVRYLPDGQAVANFSVAQPPGRLGYQDVSGAKWSVDVNKRVYEVTVHGKLAEICAKHLAKGQEIHIRGEALRNAEGKGGRVIFAEAIYFAGAPPEAEIGESVADHDDNITRWLNYEELPEGVRAPRPIGRSR